MKIWLFLVISSLLPLTGCSVLPKQQTSAQTQQNTPLRNKTPNVDLEIADLGVLKPAIEYIGTTAPFHQVSVRSQVEGRLLNLSVDVGDSVRQEQVLAKLDDNLLAVAVNREQAELATLESELARAKIQVKNAQIQLEEALVKQEQAENDANRYVELAKTGLIAQQQAESFQTAAKIAQKAVRLAKERINTEQQGITTATSRITTQKAAIAEQQYRQTFTTLVSPLNGVVLAKTREPGNLIRLGEEVLQIGDFSRVKVIVSLSELDLGSISLGQKVQVNLDSFADDTFLGKVTSIAPLADAAARQIAIEVTVANPQRKIRGGLLARVTFLAARQQRVILPESALIEENGINYVFVVDEEQDTKQARVKKQRVGLSDRANGKVAIVTGIKPGTKVVVRSSKPLSDGETVNLSVLSP